jgi:hypothetical protein
MQMILGKLLKVSKKDINFVKTLSLNEKLEVLP